MGHLIVITTSDLAPGYELAGVETISVKNSQEAEASLRKLLKEEEASLIVVRQDLLENLDPRLRHQIEASYRPVVMAIPSSSSTVGSGEGRRRYIAELIRRAIGFHITFGHEQS